MTANHVKPIETAELIENIWAWAHTAKTAELPDRWLSRIIHEFTHLRRNNFVPNELRPSCLFRTAPRATLARRASEENADGIDNVAPVSNTFGSV